MNKIKSISYLSALTLTLLTAPALAAGPVNVGLKVGTPYSKIKTDYTTSEYELGTYSIGAALDFNVGSLGFNIDFMYSLHKMGYAPDTTVVATEFKIPAVLYYDFSPIRILGGMYYTKGLGDPELETIIGTFPTTYANLGLKDVDYGLVGGLGAVIPAGAAKLTLEARYSHGLADINEFSATKSTTQSFEFLLGFFF